MEKFVVLTEEELSQIVGGSSFIGTFQSYLVNDTIGSSIGYGPGHTFGGL